MDARFARRVADIVGDRHALGGASRRNYQYDASVDRALPELVAVPGSAAEVAALVRACNDSRVPYVARGAGTGLSGGAIPEAGGLVISTARLDRILEIRPDDRLAIVEPGVVNAHITDAVKHLGLRFVPDPSSNAACTIGGNVAENSGGLHCLAYGVTANHVLGVELVDTEGDIVWYGGTALDAPGYDLLGLFVGAEGTLGIATKVVVRLSPAPECSRTLLAVFEDVDAASGAVSDIIAAGLIPGALEMMDRLATVAVEAFAHAGFPTDAAALLIVEIDALRESIDEQTRAVAEVCMRRGAREVREPRSQTERDLIWKGRKAAFGAMGRISPNYYAYDAVIPRTRLPEMLREVAEISARRGLRIANVFHAGDGNLHPLILFDERVPGELETAIAAGGDILRACALRGGSISGEHGIGMEKRDCMEVQFKPEDLRLMRRLKDAFDARGLCNPRKIFPTGRTCGESGRHKPTLAASLAVAAGEAF